MRRPPLRRMLRRLDRTLLGFATLSTLLLAGCRFETVPDENVESSVETMLARMAEAWNAGDLDAVMAFYADGSTPALVTPEGPVYGRAQIRAVYAPAFEGSAHRDRIRFEDVDVRTLPPLVGIVTGRRVSVSGTGEPGVGWFTIVVRRVGDGWRIVHDHPDFMYTPVSNRHEVRPAAATEPTVGRNQ
ncbi:MAG: nuclear transport factor 2 family protein [Gemmatimonadales bacterium]